MNEKQKTMMLQMEKNIYYTLRFAAAMCFIGHGCFGFITKQIWCNYFSVFGIGTQMAYRLMPLLGSLDVLLGISLLFYPTRAVPWWLVIWGFITAMLRPLSGEPLAELIERAGNYGPPLALLILCGNGGRITGKWFARLYPTERVDAETFVKMTNCLKLIVFLLLVGHGWLNLIEKKGIMGQYSALGFSNPANAAHLVGAFEIAGAFSALLKPMGNILMALLIWKMLSELFYPHWELFEWIERGGSYAAILALWFTLRSPSVGKPNIGLQHSIT